MTERHEPSSLKADEEEAAPALRDAAALDAARIAFHSARVQEGRMAFLARASMVLGTTLDSAATVETVANAAVPDLADVCMVDLTTPGGSRRAAVVHADPRHQPRLRRLLGQTRLEPASPQYIALTTGQTRMDALAGHDECPWPADSDEGSLMREFGIQSYLVIPLRSRGQTLGAISLLSTERRSYGAEEFATAGEFVRRASVALDNALLYESAVQARAAAEAAQEQFQLLVNGLRESEDKYRASEHFTRAIISSVRQGIIVYDRQLRYQVWNRFMEELTGLGAARLIGTRATDAFPHLHEHGVDELLKRALGGETLHAPDTPFSVPDTGRSGWVSSVYSPHMSPSGEIMGVVGIIHDITERKVAEEKLVHNAFHDALTGLPNRALFVDRLERLLRHSERHEGYVFGIAFLDLDRFKVVNDSLGHIVGDELLVSIARRLEQCVRTGDTVARLGGDEFAILLDDIGDVRDATRIADRVLVELSVPFHLAGHEIFTSASIGIALSSTGYEKTDDILRDADTAMYRAKVEGRSRYEVFDRNMHERAVHTLQVETDLRRALERREFRVHYQPIIGLDDGRIRGFEALIRWQHPVRGIVPPDEFIPLAEETGLIVGIGWWVLQEACRQMSTWLARFPEPANMTMSVNLSTKQFMQADLLEQVDTALARSGLAPQALKLEITESIVVQHEEAVTASLVALRARGIRLCIDDFGTGYSSLSYLHSFPVDTLKIDRSFVSQIGFTGSNPRLVETIITLSRNLGMETVAEGVETEEQLAFLRRLGPQYAQGFFFSRALAPEQVEEMLVLNPVW
ncbi:MAG: EAL domain-containing protein [Gemmatimonadota bacterium]